ncbi:hypothetical protein PanWU01x14_097220 [Parasponia andersonii]|uniref:Uncharacterized protein n=1 Tax=Parasponia andersonii TaxID=3476 RepID=A0A2P5D4D4_PARAD|nr:hypothetical protein PanWU01x14_097220 [Parasponia andersonii]
MASLTPRIDFIGLEWSPTTEAGCVELIRDKEEECLIIKDKYTENLKTIEVLDEVVQNLHSQAAGKLRSLVAEIERERKNNAFQAQIIAGLLPKRDPVLSSAALSMTRDIPLNESTNYDCNLGDFHEKMLDLEHEKEITNLYNFFSDHKERNRLSIENETRGLARERIGDEAVECSTLEDIDYKELR